MGDYRDIVKTAIISGFTLDKCGLADRYYTWGSFIDLCGMSVEEYMKAPANSGGGSGEGGNSSGSTKTKNTITLSMQEGSDGTNHIKLTAEKISEEDVIVSFNVDGVGTQVVTIPAGSKEVVTSISVPDGSKYATITNAVATGEDERFKYSVKNTIQDGNFTLTVIKDGVTTVETVKYNTEVAVPILDDKYGYDPVYTVQTSAGTESIDTSTETEVPMPESNTTIEAKYEPKDVEMSYSTTREVLNGDVPEEVSVSGSTETVKFDSHVSATVDDVQPEAGYSIVYEYNGVEVPNGEIGDKLVDSEDPITVTVKYKLNKYSLKYSVNSTDVVDDELYYTQATTEPTEQSIVDNTPVGFRFDGWNRSVPATMPAEDIEVVAVLNAIDYTATYVVDVDKPSEARTAATYTLHYGDTVPVPSEVSQEGYTFHSWENVPATMPAEDIVLRASLEINSYELQYWVLVNGTEESDQPYSSVTLEYGSEIIPAELPSDRVGYTRSENWLGLPATMPAGNVSATCEYNVNDYVLTFLDSTGGTFNRIEGAYGDPVPGGIGEPEKIGYTFDGWDNEIPATIPAQDMTFTPQYTINSYVLSYYVDGALLESAETEYDSVIVPAAEPEREGYTFGGWDSVPERMPANDVDVHGQFIVNTWEIKYYLDGELYLSEEHDYGEDIQVAQIPESRVGYTFSGWTYEEFPATMPNHDIEVYGVFNINSHTLTFFVDGDTYSSITADYGTTGLSIETPSADTGYHFDGWKDANGNDVAVPDTMPDEDLSFYGTIEINIHVASYYITDENGNRTLNSQVEYEYGATITYPEVQVPEGYVLKWNKEHATMPDMNIDIEGMFEEFVESNTIYYGFVNANEPKSVTPDGLSSYDNVDGVETAVNFVLPADMRYAELETDEEFDNWDVDEMNDYIILAPASLSVAVYDAAKNRMNQFNTAVATGDIDGTSYKAYGCPATVPIDVDQTFQIYITATKN